jgi:hypothetical protein
MDNELFLTANRFGSKVRIKRSCEYYPYAKGLASISSSFVLFLFLGVALSPCYAQGKKLGTAEPVKKPASPGRQPSSVRVVEHSVTVVKKVGSLTVSTEPGALVVLQPALKTGKRRQATADEKGTVIFESPLPGAYKIEATKPEFDSKTDEIRILPQQPYARRLDLKPITYKLNIKTQLTSGSVRYSRRQDGSSGDVGNYCVLVIRPNGEALLGDLRKGQYDIDIQPDSLEWEKKRISISVPQDTLVTDPAAGADIKTIPVQLENKKSTETFSTTAWLQADWNLPAGWKLDKGMKVKNAPGVALPANERFRYYLDFELIANAKLDDDGTMGFALWAKNDKNYYLLQISGAKGQEQPNTVSLYAVREGVPRYITSLTAAAFASALASDRGFRVRIRGEKVGFTIFIEDTDGREHAVGQVKDDLNEFQKGAIGIAASNKSDFEIKYFLVCASTCQQ